MVNGYPILTNNPNLGTNGESLAYLFDASAQEGKESYGTVNHLLYVDPEGYYTYDSRDFKAYIQNDGNFKVYNQPDTTDTELKGFWPFGDQIFWSGLHMNTQFSMPTNGQVLNPKGEMKDMQFEFSGDDDTWLYIDGVLVGDGGGIHNRTEIDVNFAKGTVTVTGKKDDNHTGTFEETKYLDDIFKAAGKYNDTDWEDIGDGSGHKRFKAGTYHTFDMFYLERGGGESNLYIHYNLVSTADFTGVKNANIANLAFTDDAATADITAADATFEIAMMKLGDINDNGEIEIGDATCVINNIVGTPNDVYIEEVADVNGEEGPGEIGDATVIVNMVVGTASLAKAVVSEEVDSLPDPE